MLGSIEHHLADHIVSRFWPRGMGGSGRVLGLKREDGVISAREVSYRHGVADGRSGMDMAFEGLTWHTSSGRQRYDWHGGGLARIKPVHGRDVIDVAMS